MAFPRLTDRLTEDMSDEEKVVCAALYTTHSDLVLRYLEAQDHDRDVANWPVWQSMEAGSSESSHLTRVRDELAQALSELGIDFESALIEAELARIREALGKQ